MGFALRRWAPTRGRPEGKSLTTPAAPGLGVHADPLVQKLRRRAYSTNCSVGVMMIRMPTWLANSGLHTVGSINRQAIEPDTAKQRRMSSTFHQAARSGSCTRTANRDLVYLGSPSTHLSQSFRPPKLIGLGHPKLSPCRRRTYLGCNLNVTRLRHGSPSWLRGRYHRPAPLGFVPGADDDSLPNLERMAHTIATFTSSEHRFHECKDTR